MFCFRGIRAQLGSGTDSPARDFWRTYGNGITDDSESIRLVLTSSPAPQTDDVPPHTATELSEPVIAFGSPRSDETQDDLLDHAPARNVSQSARPSPQGDQTPNSAALAGVGSGGGGVGGASTSSAGGGGNSAGNGGAGPGAAGFTGAELAAMTAGANNAGMPAAPAAANPGPTNGPTASPAQSVLTPLPLASPAGGATLSSTSPSAAQTPAATPNASPMVDSPQQASTTTLTTSANPATPGQSVTFTAAVSGNSGTPTGSVSFKDGTTVLGTVPLDANGNATFTTSSLPLGNQTIAAVYGGDAAYSGSIAFLTQTVNYAASSTSLTSNANPSPSGQAVTFTATVSGNSGTPTGNVTFYDGNTALAIVPLNASGVATYTTSTLTNGSHDITAIYSGGDNTYASSTASLTQAVGSLTVSGTYSGTTSGAINGYNFGGTISGTISGNTFSETFSGGPFDGISFNYTINNNTYGGPMSGTISFAGINFACSGTQSGTISGSTFSGVFSGTYSSSLGNGTFSGTSSGTISGGSFPLSSSISLSSSANPATPNQAVTFTATAIGNSGTPTGSFTFYDGTTVLGTTQLNASGVATFTTSTLPLGNQAITSIYSGDSTYTGSTAALLQNVIASTLVANDDSYSLPHDSTLNVPAAAGVLANDTGPQNLPLSAVLVSGPSDGSLTFNSDGSFTYTPDTGYFGSDSFTYYASNGQLDSSIATVTLTVDSTISGQAWLDSNQDGIEDNGETGMAGVTVNLVLPDGALVTSTTTDANGNYELDVDPSLGSQFQVQVDIPDGDSATIPFASSSGIVSCIDDAGYSNLLTLPSSGGISNVNAGIATGSGPLASISGEVWLDSNDNGTLDTGETGLQAINVNLLDGNGNIVDSTSTDDNGDYSFFGLTPNTPYTVQFVAPNGYVFSPQNIGAPATSSSAGANGSTSPIILSPSQNDSTVNAGLYGSAPIVYQTDAAITAENDSYTGMDFTANGYDPNDEPLTSVIVQAPTAGSLVYDTSTGLYDYTAPSNYTGLDSFQYELSNGQGVSEVVTVQILDHNGIIQPGVYDNFPAMATALFDGGQPTQSSIKQGNIGACWFVSAAAGLAQQRPNEIVNMIQYNAGTDTYTVTFPGQTPVIIAGFEHEGNSYSEANGDWLAVLEKAYGQMIYNQKWATWGNTPYGYIDRANLPSAGVEALTGHSTNVDYFSLTRDSVTRQNLINAFANNKVVTAQIFGFGKNAKMAKQNGLVAHHIYTVVAYDATTDRVRLRNPWGSNPVFNNGTDPQFYLGKDQTDGGNGYFWMSLSDFTKKFSAICYEE